MVKNLSGKPFPAFDSQQYAAGFTPTKKPDETRKIPDEITENVDKRNGKTTKNQRVNATLLQKGKVVVAILSQIVYNSRERNETEGPDEWIERKGRFSGLVAVLFPFLSTFPPMVWETSLSLSPFRILPVRTYLIYMVVPVPGLVGSGSHGIRQGKAAKVWDTLVGPIRY